MSKDAGETFQLVNSEVGLPSGSISSLVYDNKRPGVLFCAVLNAGVFRSIDGGNSWKDISSQEMKAFMQIHHTTLPIAISLSMYQGYNESVLYSMIVINGEKEKIMFNAHLTHNNTEDYWEEMDSPQEESQDKKYNLFNAGLGWIHGSIFSHPTDPNVVYVISCNSHK